MSWTPWVVGGMVAVVLGLFAWLGWRAWQVLYTPWKPLYGYYPGTLWHSQVSTDPDAIVRALQMAETLLIQHTQWTAANLALVGHHVRVYVMATETWDLFGRKVAGVQFKSNLVVGPSLSALCHELAHLCQRVLDRKVDLAHAGWSDAGIYAAIYAYERWLNALPQAHPSSAALNALMHRSARCPRAALSPGEALDS